jgi:O-antigen/teichoic acid export membrane protein
MTPSSYGALGAVLAAMVMLAVPLSGLQVAASTTAASQGRLTRATARRALRTSALIALPGAVALFFLAPAVRDWFHLTSLGDALLLAPYLFVSVILAMARGLLLGSGGTSAVAAGFVAGVAVRLGGILLLGTATTFQALLLTLAGEVTALAVALVACHVTARDGSTESLGLRRVTRSTFALCGLFAFSSVDLFLARHHLADTQSGNYVAGATVAKTVLALPAAAMAVVLPRLVAGWAARRPGTALKNAMLLVGGSALVGGLVVAAVPELVLGLLFGSTYAGNGTLLRVLVLVAVLTSFVSIAVHSAIARGATLTLALPWLGAILEVVLIELHHGSTAQIATISVAAAVPTLLAVIAIEGLAFLRNGRTVKARSAIRVKPALALLPA